MINADVLLDELKNKEVLKEQVVVYHFYEDKKILFCLEKQTFKALIDIKTDDKNIASVINLESIIHSDDVVLFCISSEKSAKAFELHFRMMRQSGEILILKGKFEPFLEHSLEDTAVFLANWVDVKTLISNVCDMGIVKANFEALMEHTDDFIYFKDINHVMTASSDTLAVITGYQKGYEVVGKTDYEIFPKEHADKYYELEKEIYKGGIPHAKEIQPFIDQNRNEGWVDNRKYPILNNSNEIIGLFGIARIVTENINNQKKIEKQNQELEAERNRFALAIEGAQDGLWDWNIQTNHLILSERFETMLGYTQGDLSQSIESWFGLLHPEDRDMTTKTVQEYLYSKGEGSYEAHFRLRAKDGSWRWILGRGKALFNTDGTPLRFVGFNTDISHQMEYQNKLEHTAKHDSLTHLPNRFLLSELLTHAMHSVKRNNQHLALLFIDLDGFKEINDTYGHDAGDAVLSIVAQRMSDLIRGSDIVSRIGGDEFVIVVSELKNSREVIPMLQRLLSDLSCAISYGENSMHVSASIGVSFYPQATDIGNEALLRQADQAMYHAKLSGKNQYQFFNLEASQELKEQQQNILNLRHAITMEQFVLYYQPKVNMATNKVIGFEALLRWNHPEKGLVFPDSFLPYVEHESSFMVDLGHWVFEHAFAQLEVWHLEGYDFTININVSSHDVKQEGFSTYLKELFSKHPSIKPNTIEIELLETSAFDNFEGTSNILRECKELGISIAIDDFGTGYASLHYLKKLPMNTIKIDKSFIIELLNSGSNLSIVEASIGLANAFSCHVVAEGVESEEHGKVLLQLGCEVAQGYAIAKAMPPEEVLSWVHSWSGYEVWREIKPISADGRAILHASVEHRSWINTVEAFLFDKTSKEPELRVTECHLGNWLAYDASAKQKNHPLFQELKEVHSELHNYAKKLLVLSKNEKIIGIKKLHELRKEILKKLEELMDLKE